MVVLNDLFLVFGTKACGFDLHQRMYKHVILAHNSREYESASFFSIESRKKDKIRFNWFSFFISK